MIADEILNYEIKEPAVVAHGVTLKEKQYSKKNLQENKKRLYPS